jgi:hypothetical protein
VTHPWYNQMLARVNDSVVRLGVMKGEYHWHEHAEDDEFSFVLEGKFLIDLEPQADGVTPGRVVTLGPREGFRRAQRRAPSDARACALSHPDGGDRRHRPHGRLDLRLEPTATATGTGRTQDSLSSVMAAR